MQTWNIRDQTRLFRLFEVNAIAPPNNLLVLMQCSWLQGHNHMTLFKEVHTQGRSVCGEDDLCSILCSLINFFNDRVVGQENSMSRIVGVKNMVGGTNRTLEVSLCEGLTLRYAFQEDENILTLVDLLVHFNIRHRHDLISFLI